MNNNTGSTKTTISISKSWSNVVGKIPVEEEIDLTMEKSETNVKITMADIKDEVEYWSTAVVCYVQ